MLTNLRSQARAYYRLAKPGIIYGNALMYGTGFFLASNSGIDWILFIEGLLGLSLVIGSACVFNNYADREMDQKMERTAKRALVTGKIAPRQAIIYALILLALGTGILYYFCNTLTLASALLGFIVYVFLYTPLKPKTPYALYVGAVAGAMPPVVGYVAVSNRLDWYAFWLFVAMFAWQIPHFLAIAFRRYDDYTAAGVPLHLPRGAKNDAERKIALRVFFGSLIILLVACLGIALWRIFF